MTTTNLTQPDSDDVLDNTIELIFLYDTTYSNPNGNPTTEENRPRFDARRDRVLVSPERIKRVIRDYLDRNGDNIFIKKVDDDDGDRHDKDDRYEAIMAAEDNGDEDVSERTAFLNNVIDVRLFGDSMAGGTLDQFDSITGPAQFDMSQSIHATEQTALGKTSVLNADSDGDNTGGGNMFTEHVIPYAMINTHGVIDAARASNALLTRTDVDKLIDGLWFGTREMTNTSSKRGHEPRFLVEVEYDGNTQLGDLHNEVDFTPTSEVTEEKAMRDVNDGYVDVTELLETLGSNEEKIESVTLRVQRRTQFRNGDETGGVEFIESAFETALSPDTVTVTEN